MLNTRQIKESVANQQVLSGSNNYSYSIDNANYKNFWGTTLLFTGTGTGIYTLTLSNNIPNGFWLKIKNLSNGTIIAKGDGVVKIDNGGNVTDKNTVSIKLGGEVEVRSILSGTISIKTEFSNFIGRFEASNDVSFYEDEYIRLRWLTSQDQFQYLVKQNGFWYDSSNLTLLGNSTSVNYSGGDVSSTGGQWKYFSDDGTLKANLKLGNWGARCYLYLGAETWGTRENLPTYFIEGAIGNTNIVSYSIKKIY